MQRDGRYLLSLLFSPLSHLSRVGLFSVAFAEKIKPLHVFIKTILFFCKMKRKTGRKINWSSKKFLQF